MIPPEIEQIIQMIGDPDLQKKVRTIVRRPRIHIWTEGHGLPVATSPAGLSRHHSYDKGLIDHIVSSTRVALALCNVVEEVYRGKVNRDYVIAGVLLHDIMKPLTYQEKENGGYQVTELGQRLDHLSLIVAEGYHKKLPIDLLHVLASHHGESSPMGPRTLEALVVSLSDLLDARLAGEVQRAAQFGIKDCLGEEAGMLTAEEAFNIVYARQTRGCDGVRDVFERVRQRRLTSAK